MKIRSGFVSNSSSSSFIVAFDEIPHSAHRLQQLLFGEEREWTAYDDPVPTRTLAQIVWRDIQAQMDKLPYAPEVIADDLRNLVYWNMFYVDEEVPGMPPGCVTSSQYRKHYWEEYREPSPEREAAREEEDREIKQRQKEAAQEFLQANEGKIILRFEYCDNDGSVFSTLEHGDVFRNLPHIQISNH